MDRKEHWENIYRTKKINEVSWYEPVPETSLDLIKSMKLDKDAKIIDIGGGDSFLADFLLMDGYTNITVLDISEEALGRIQSRLGDRAQEINWIVADASEFEPEESYDLWHDRAAFHFLTEEEQIENYLSTLRNAVKPGGFVVLGTFSKQGPTKCSGIEIKQYSVDDLYELLKSDFERLNSQNVEHNTPSGLVQEFSFCSFRRR